MIELPETPAPNSVTPALIDYGFVQRPALGARATRIDRPGSRFRAEIGFPPMKPDVARVFLERLLAAKREGLRIEYPLLGVNQGIPGAPTVGAAEPTGTELPISGLTPGYAFKKGYWLTLVDDVTAGNAAGLGARMLHVCRSNAVADEAGEATITIEPPIRAPLAEGATILLAQPTIEGFLLGEEFEWGIQLEKLITLSVSIEEWG